MPSRSLRVASNLLVRFDCPAGDVTPPTKHEWDNTHEDEQHSDPEPTEGGG
jgi:hypothetical protein